MNTLKQINDLLMKVFNTIMFIASGLVCGMIIVGAFMRYILHKDFYGSEELILLAAFWMYYIGSAVATYEDSHISADLIRSSLKSEKALAVQKFLVTIVSLFLFLILSKWSYDFIMWSIDKGATTAVYKFPMVYSQASLLFTFVLSSIYTVMHLVKSVAALKKAFSTGNPEKEAVK